MMKLNLSIRRSRLPQSILAAALAVAALAACQALPQLVPPDPPDAEVAGSDPLTPAAAPTIPTGAPTVAPAWASTAYPGMATAYPPPAPAEPPAVLHDVIDALPAGAKPDIAAAWLLDGRDKALIEHAVPIRLANGALDLAVVISNAKSSASSWSLRRDGDLSIDPIRINPQPISIADHWVIHGAEIEAADGTRGLLVWNGLLPEQDSPVMLRAWLPLAGVDFVPQDSPVGLVFTDWSGDGAMDALLEADDGRAAVLYAATDGPHVFRSVARIVPPTQVVDVDGDGAYELVRREGDLWRVERWGGEAFAAAEPIPAALPTPVPVADGSLPPLPADLLFMRGDTEIWQWPRAGGALQRVMADPGVGRTDGWQGGEPRLTNFRVAREGGQIAYPLGRFEKQGPEGYDVEVTELFVFDPATGETTKVAPDIADQAPDNDELSYFDITPSGDFAVFVGPTLTPDRCLSAISIAPVADPGRVRTLGSCGRREGEFSNHCGCDGLMLSPDGRRVAFSDRGGLWVADLPDGEARQLTANSAEQENRAIAVYQPRTWSPDGRYLISSVGYFEGSGNVLWDVDAGTQRDLGLFEYVGPPTDLAWIQAPQLSALIRGTSGQTPLSLTAADREAPPVPLLSRLWPTDLHQGPTAVAPHQLHDSGIGFALRLGDPEIYPGNGIFRTGTDGKSLRPLVGLPTGEKDELGHRRHDLTGDLNWSPSGLAYLLLSFELSEQEPAPAILGLSDGSGNWDVREVLGTGDVGGFAWVERGAE